MKTLISVLRLAQMFILQPDGLNSELTKSFLNMKSAALQSLLLVVLASAACAGSESPLSLDKLRESGAFEFPQKQAMVLCDRADLRFSVWNNGDYLFAQAVLWTDDDSSLGKSEENRPIGDWSEVMLDLDADGKRTSNVDRDYMLNPWPHLGGLHYQICLRSNAWSGIKSDSKGRGAIRYLTLSNAKRVRVDTYLIPMAEISRQVGNKIRICYWGYSPKPRLTVNSAGYKRSIREIVSRPFNLMLGYYAYDIPLSRYYDYVLARGSEVDVTKVPEGRNDISLSHGKNVKMPDEGQPAPEIAAKEWINLNRPLTLVDLRGKVVLLEFWATCCGPCVEGIPHLNELQRKYAGKNFQLLTLVEEGHQTMDKFLNRKAVEYPIGLESTSLEDYGINVIPHAFLISPDGQILWHGHPAEHEMETAISSAVNEAK